MFVQKNAIIAGGAFGPPKIQTNRGIKSAKERNVEARQ
jgi:hypothetical protein